MKEISNSQKKLLISLAVVLVALITVSRISVGDENILVGANANALWEEVDLTKVFAHDRTDRFIIDDGNVRSAHDDETDAGSDGETVYIAEAVETYPPEGVILVDAIGSDTDDLYIDPDPEKYLTPAPLPEQPDGQTGETGDESEIPLTTPSPTPTVITPTPTPAYGETLLVTDQRFYDADAVAEAKRLAGLTQEERYLLLTDTAKDTYTVAHKAPGYENEAAAMGHMAVIDVPVWKLKSSGAKVTSHMTITVNAKLADSLRCIFSDIYLLKEKFPICEIVSFTYRKVIGAGLGSINLMSDLSFGAALQINPGDYDNDLYVGAGNDLRDKKGTYYISKEVIDVFKRYGWYWGGDAGAVTATSFFTYLGLDGLKFEGEPPYPMLSKDATDMKPEYIINLTGRLYELGYMNTISIVFDDSVEKALKSFQKANGLKQSGKTDVQTWTVLINKTHYMSYAF